MEERRKTWYQRLAAKPIECVLKSLFQEDFSCVKEQVAMALERNPDKTKLFGVILCEYFEEIKKCEDVGLKIIALKNALTALEYLEKEAGCNRSEYEKEAGKCHR